MTLKWAKSWGAAEKGKDLRRIMPSPSKHVLNLHKGINKAHSSLIAVPNWSPPLFIYEYGAGHHGECRREKQTLRHVTTQCRKHSQLRRETWKTLEKREPFGTIEWTKMLNHPLYAQKAAIFMKNTRLLSQFEHVALIPL